MSARRFPYALAWPCARLSLSHQAFTWAVVSRESSSADANAVAKGDSFFSDWRVGHGGGGGSISTVEAFTTTSNCGAATVSQTDLQHFQAWVGTIQGAPNKSKGVCVAVAAAVAVCVCVYV